MGYSGRFLLVINLCDGEGRHSTYVIAILPADTWSSSEFHLSEPEVTTKVVMQRVEDAPQAPTPSSKILCQLLLNVLFCFF